MRAENTDTVNCPSCGSALIAGLRFCRMCGYRLGEGVEEYVPTQRFDASSMPTAAPPPPATDPFAARQTWGAAPMQPIQPFGATSALNQPQPAGAVSGWTKPYAPKRRNWWLWLTITIVLLVAAGAVPLSFLSRNRARTAATSTQPANSLIAEADDYDTPDGGGAMIRGLAGPGTSLEAAGLLGGDTITHFDGKPVRDENALRKLIAATPVGKAVEVIFIRDGEPPRKTVLTTKGRGEFQGMAPIDARPGGRGILGVDLGSRVRLPNSNIFGVELSDVNRNGPADLAGLKEGDVVFDFGGKPVRTPGDLRLRIYEAVPGSTIPVSVMRDGQRVDIEVKIGRQR